MPTASFPRRAAAPRRSCRTPKATSEQAIAEAKGQSARFLQVYDEYKKAPEVTRQRIYLETMERVLGNADKMIIDGGGSSPDKASCRICRSSELTPRRQAAPAAGQPQQQSGAHPMKSGTSGIVALLVLAGRA